MRKELEAKPVGRVPSESDDSDKLVTEAKNGRNRRGLHRKEIYASGGLGTRDAPRAHKPQKQARSVSHPTETVGPIVKEKRTFPSQAAAPGINGLPSAQEPEKVVNQYNSDLTSPSATALRLVNGLDSQVQSTPGAENSILGTIRPRRRQPSILRMIDNNDSSQVGNDEEDKFLPNDESTPLNLGYSKPLPSLQTPPISQSVLSRKRKINTSLTNGHTKPHSHPTGSHPRRSALDITSASQSELEMPPQPKSTLLVSRDTVPTAKDDDIMAPPQGSSPVQSPTKTSVASSPTLAKTKKVAKAPSHLSTNALQALMPARRQRSRRGQPQVLGDFDIPADSSSEREELGGAGLDVDESRYLPDQKRQRGKVRRQEPRKQALRQNNTQMRSKGRGRAGTASTMSPIRVTPLKRPPSTAAKNSSLQQPRSVLAMPIAGPRPSITYSSRDTGKVSTDKENLPAGLSESFSSPANGEGGEFSEDDDDAGLAGNGKTEKSIKNEIEGLQIKFADVDAWEMEFEDVMDEGIGYSSSPNGKTRLYMR